MEQEAVFVDFQPFPNHHKNSENEQIQIVRRSFSNEQPSIRQGESSSPRSLPSVNNKDSQFRNFAKHYSKTIKNIIKSHINVWPLDQVTRAVARKIVQSLEKTHHPPKRMIDAIFCRTIQFNKFSLIGYEVLLDKFTREELIYSCSRIKEFVISYVKRQDSNLMIGRKITNPQLFIEYMKKATKEYENYDRFSFRMRPEDSRQIREKIGKKQTQKQPALSYEENKFFEKFAQPQSNFLDCIQKSF